MNKLRFYAFHLMPYPFIPPAEDFDSTWVSLSNKYYDPHRGRVLYNEYIDQLVAAEKFGFDDDAPFCGDRNELMDERLPE